ncbi:hypothetical protein Hanom_Chr00s120888g01811561 [Helianthus anomalus]
MLKCCKQHLGLSCDTRYLNQMIEIVDENTRVDATLAFEDDESQTNCGYDDGTVRSMTRGAYSPRTKSRNDREQG